MSVTNYWKNYYLNREGKLKKVKKTFVPKYLNKPIKSIKRSNSFNFGQSAVKETPGLPRDISRMSCKELAMFCSILAYTPHIRQNHPPFLAFPTKFY